MAKYSKSVSISGNWIKGSDVMSGTRAKILTETKPVESSFQDKEGKNKTQDVCKVKFEGKEGEFNISLNRATRDALIDAFGDDSVNWIGKVLTATTEKMVVGGKRVTALYLVPEGFVLTEDENGYMVMVRDGEKPQAKPVPEVSSDDIPF